MFRQMNNAHGDGENGEEIGGLRIADAGFGELEN